jgi:hypothetical protein
MVHETSWAVEGAKLSADEVRELEARLESNPEDLVTRVRLLGSYFTNKETGARQKRQEPLCGSRPTVRIQISPARLTWSFTSGSTARCSRLSLSFGGST